MVKCELVWLVCLQNNLSRASGQTVFQAVKCVRCTDKQIKKRRVEENVRSRSLPCALLLLCRTCLLRAGSLLCSFLPPGPAPPLAPPTLTPPLPSTPTVSANDRDRLSTSEESLVAPSVESRDAVRDMKPYLYFGLTLGRLAASWMSPVAMVTVFANHLCLLLLYPLLLW